MDIKQAVEKVIRGDSLNFDESRGAAVEIMEGRATDAQIAALLVSLRMKGETPHEISGFALAMREKATRVACAEEDLVDTCGTGGDKSGTFNVSTLSAFVAAGAGCPVAKHGNRSVSSRCGSADLFSELGVEVNLSPERIARCVDEAGIGFLFAPNLHPAMKHAIGPRREIGIRTVFNIIGPLTNPAGAKRQVLGVYDGELTDVLTRVLSGLGARHILAVHGEDGLDEITLTGETRVSELKDGTISRYRIRPEDFGFKRTTLKALQGGDAKTNAQIALRVLGGETGPARDMVLLNSGAVIYAGGKAGNIADGIQMARESIDSGKAMEKLIQLRRMTSE
jgi:anthranilate phosphoribosyltransferase